MQAALEEVAHAFIDVLGAPLDPAAAEARQPLDKEGSFAAQQAESPGQTDNKSPGPAQDMQQPADGEDPPCSFRADLHKDFNAGIQHLADGLRALLYVTLLSSQER